MKIRQPNSSEIEVQFPTNRRKHNYIKLGEAHKDDIPQKTNKRPIQINTNLEPSQSKKQYHQALAQAKAYKEQTDAKKAQSSISCGSITVNFSKADEKEKKTVI